MRFHILTIFPDVFDPYLNESMFQRAQKNKVVSAQVLNIRDFTNDRHNKVDDRPFGGGPGMVIKVQPVWSAMKAVERDIARRGAHTRKTKMKGKKKLRARTIL